MFRRAKATTEIYKYNYLVSTLVYYYDKYDQITSSMNEHQAQPHG